MISGSPPPSKDDVTKRLNALKFRISAKKIEANLLFSDIVSENNELERLKEPLEIIRDALEKQQAEEGSIGIDQNI